MSKNISDQLVEALVDAGIQRIYAVTGDSLNHVNAAVHRNGKIKWIHVRHEETAAFAAGAEAQLNGLACCAGSSGPGHVHLINGLYDAHRSSASVLAIASTIPTLPKNLELVIFRKPTQSNFLKIAVVITRLLIHLHNYHVCCKPLYRMPYIKKG